MTFKSHLEDETLESSLTERDLELWLTSRTQAARKTTCILECIKQSIASLLREEIGPLCMVQVFLEYCVQLWEPQYKKCSEKGCEDVERKTYEV